MNRKKIHRMLIKIGIGILLICQITGQIAMATMGTGMINHNINHFGDIPKSQVECLYKTNTNNKTLKTDIKVKSSNTTNQYGEKLMLTGKITGQYASHDWFLNRLNNLARGNNKKIEIFSGYRSFELQQQLFNDSDKSGKMVARAGYSRHNAGLAVDCTGWVCKLNNSYLAKYGLYKPMDYEDWHIEPIETKGKSTQQIIAQYGIPTEINKLNKEINVCESEIQKIVDKEIIRIDKEIIVIKTEMARIEMLKAK